MVRTEFHQCLQGTTSISTNTYSCRLADLPPKLPETTNLVLTRSRKEYREMSAMNVKMALENNIPPLKKLYAWSAISMGSWIKITYALPRKRIPVPTKDFSN